MTWSSSRRTCDASTAAEVGRSSRSTDATFSVPAGRRIAIVGPSGSGKSTLLHLMAGIDVPTSGVMTWPAIGGRDSLRPGPIAVAFQGPSLLPALTVTENVALPLLLEGRDEPSALAAAATCLDLFDLGEVADKLPEEISGGQSQRAGLARALVSEPRLVLVDEPTGQLDRETAARTMLALLDAIVAGGAALVVATHDLDVAERMDASWRMDSGDLRTEATRCSA